MYEIVVKTENHTIYINSTDKTEVGKHVGLCWNPEDIHFVFPVKHKYI
jgi:hypothetical protein